MSVRAALPSLVATAWSRRLREREEPVVGLGLVVGRLEAAAA